MGSLISLEGLPVLRVSVALPKKGDFLLVVNGMQGQPRPNVEIRLDRLLLFKLSNKGNGSPKTFPTFQQQLEELMGVRSNEALDVVVGQT